MKDGKWGYADLSGNTVIPVKFESAGVFDQGTARVRLNGKNFFINHKGRKVSPDFPDAFEFSEGLAAVDVGKKVGYIGRNGKFVLQPKYHGASGINFSEGLVAFRIEMNVGFMDAKGRIVIQPFYDDACPFSEGRAPVRLGYSWGYIDKNGTEVIPVRFHIAHMFNEGVASVQLIQDQTEGGKWGFIDHSGAFEIPAIYDHAMPFCAGLAEVETYKIIGKNPFCRSPRYQGKHGLINHAGEYVWREPVERIWDADFCF